MKAERTPPPMSNPSLDREIEAVVSVEHSPEFVAHVRTRIAAAPSPVWTLTWTSLAAGSIVAAILVAVIISKPQKLVQQEAMGPATTGLVRVATPPNDVPVSRNLNSAKPPGRDLALMPIAESREQELLNISDETDVMRDLLVNLQLERVDLSSMAIKPQPLPEFTFAPLPIFKPMAVLQGDSK